MRIEASNLPGHITCCAHEDLDAVFLMAPQHGVTIPHRSIRLVALDGTLPTGLPPHQLQTPEAQMPVAFAARCDWEKLRQSFQLVEEDETIWAIGGSAIGALYGFGEVLRCLTGVIWAGLCDSDTLFGPPRALPTDVQTPLFAFRARDGGPASGSIGDFARFLGRNRYNMWRRRSDFWASRPQEYRDIVAQTCAARGIHLTLGDHAIEYFLPDLEFEEHPEWFGLRDGERCRTGYVTMPDCPHLNAQLPIQPCFSNEELAETLTDRIAAHMREYPEAGFYGLWPHDGVNNWCQCEPCKASTPYEHMYNLALRLEPKLPEHVPIELIAYSNLLNVPKRELPRSERTFTMLCPYLRHYRHRIYDDGGPTLQTGISYPEPDRINPVDEREYGELYLQWEKVWQGNGSVPAIFEYGAGFYDETRRTDRTRYLYHPPLEIRADEFAWYAARGVQVMYMCSFFRCWPDSYHEVGLPEMMWGSLTPSQFREHYYRALAGQHGDTLAAALEDVADQLSAEANPAAQIIVLRQILNDWKSDAGDLPSILMFEIWCDYVGMARYTRECELSGDYAAGIEMEKKIAAFFQEHQEKLAPYLAINVARLSDINLTRLTERMEGKLGSDYTL